MSIEPADLVEEQKEYYRVRAGEYDEWFLRQGRYDHGPEFRARWDAEVEEVRSALAAWSPAGRVLELACGTGWWTEQLVRHAGAVTAVDASDEVLELNRRRVGDGRVRYVQADIFGWRPDAAYDVVFFSFWLSHVPPARAGAHHVVQVPPDPAGAEDVGCAASFEDFWALVRGALRPGGRAIFVDSLRTELSTARGHVLPAQGDVVSLRRLNDGREFRIVKVFYRPDDLAGRLAALGWKPEVSATETFFLYGQAERGE